MNKNIIIGILAVLVVLLGFVALNYYIYYSKQGSMESAMHDMNAELSGVSGDALDKVFLEQMIVHHEGAVAMAEQVLERGVHTELKEMATAIITAQTAEITQMKQWLFEWYGAHPLSH